MPRNTYLYENRLFTNKVRRSIILGEEGKDRVVLIKSLIYVRVWKSRLKGVLYKI